MKNYATIILALIAFDLSGQSLGIARFLFEPVIKPLDYRPPEVFDETRGRGGFHGHDNRVTPNRHGDSTSYGHNSVDFSATYDQNDGTYDQNSSTYNMPFGQIYHGSDLPLKSMTVGNPLNNLNERWHTPFSPDIVFQNPDRFTPPDNRYNPNLVLQGTLAESPWQFYASPQISMEDPLSHLRNPMSMQKSDGSYFIGDQRLTSLNWDTLASENELVVGYDGRMGRIDSVEMGGFFQDGMVSSTTDFGDFLCGGHDPNPAGQMTRWHSWEMRHFSSLTRAGLDAKRSIPLQGIYAWIDDPSTEHHYHQGGAADVRASWHWGWRNGNNADKPIFNVGWSWIYITLGGAPFGPLGGGPDGNGGVIQLTDCTFYGNTDFGGLSFNEKYGGAGAGGALQGAWTGNNGEINAVNPGNAPITGLQYTLTGTTSENSTFTLPDGTAGRFVDGVWELDATSSLAGHPEELHGSSLSPWNEDFGYDLSRFFGDFYTEPSVWTINMNDAANPLTSTGVIVDRLVTDPNFMNPISRANQISTRSMVDVMRMGDMRRKIRHINRFPQSGLDYLFQSELGQQRTILKPANGNRIPVFTQ